ncbi:beta-lactamase family protein [Nocardia puris]|nr:beta-lactamase family protein [Nocardia puris]MBF6459494.1 beta-lactamase family protein [Nocardia puris]
MMGGRGGASWRVAGGALLAVFGFLLLAVFPAGPVGAQEAAGDVDAAAVDRFVEEYLDRTGLPGVAVAITHGDRVVHVAGYGTDSTGAAITGDSPMPVASVSKSFAALAVMQLVEAGRVSLDEPVRRYLPDFVMADDRAERITVRQLMQQTSGMADSAFADLRMPQAHSLEEAVTRLKDAELASEPGTEYHYHNPNFQVAARIVEVVAGQPYGDYLREHIFEPIGMADSYTVDRPADAHDVPRGHIRLYGKAIAVGEIDWFVNGSHGIVTTAADLARWLTVQNGGGRAGEGPRIATEESVNLMHAPSPVGGYRMGWQYDETDPTRVYHGGDWFTYTAQQVLLPETGYGIAVLANMGMGLEDDPAIIADGLVALTRGQDPEVRRPAGIYADWALGAATLGVVVGAGVLIGRAKGWADRRAGWPLARTVATQLPYLAAIPPLVLLPQLGSLVFAGRAGGYEHVLYVLPSAPIFLVVASVAGAAVVAVRAVRLRARRTAPADPPSAEAVSPQSSSSRSVS